MGILCILPFYQFRRFYQQFDAAAFREFQDDPKKHKIHAPEENSRRDAAGTVGQRWYKNQPSQSGFMSRCISW
jgi:hypothetical protein